VTLGTYGRLLKQKYLRESKLKGGAIGALEEVCIVLDQANKGDRLKSSKARGIIFEE
jgi:hypothetical protein